MSDDNTQQPPEDTPADGTAADGTPAGAQSDKADADAGAQPAKAEGAPAAGAHRAEAKDAPGGRAERSGEKQRDDRSRKWWHKQRFVIPIAVVVLLVAALAVGMWLRSERETASPAAGAAGASAEASAPPSGAAAGPSGDATQDGARGDDEQADPRTAQVCERIVAFQRDLRANGIDLLEAANELSEIEREARGTRLAEQANALAEEAEDFMFGRSDVQDVLDRGEDLVAAC